jgi:hypothetical protein
MSTVGEVGEVGKIKYRPFITFCDALSPSVLSSNALNCWNIPCYRQVAKIIGNYQGFGCQIKIRGNVFIKPPVPLPLSNRPNPDQTSRSRPQSNLRFHAVQPVRPHSPNRTLRHPFRHIEIADLTLGPVTVGQCAHSILIPCIQGRSRVSRGIAWFVKCLHKAPPIFSTDQ